MLNKSTPLIALMTALAACAIELAPPDPIDDPIEEPPEARIEKDKSYADDFVNEPDPAMPVAALADLLEHAEDFDGGLQALATIFEPEQVVFVGLLPGYSEVGGNIYLDAAVAPTVLVDETLTDPEGVYHLVDVTFSDGACTNTTPVKEAGESKKADGMCNVIAIARSLADNLEVIDDKWPGIVDGDKWDDDFLRKISERAGGKRALLDADEKEAHTADWNSKWKVTQTHTSGYQGDSCESVEKWCKTLEKYVEEDADDCILSIYGVGDVAHAVPVPVSKRSVSYKKLSNGDCYCDVKSVNTHHQDAPAGSFKGVARRPTVGNYTWRVRPNKAHVLETYLGLGGYRWRNVMYHCYGEWMKKDAGENDAEKPGKAFD